jgi:polyphenol oxidase
VQETTETSLAGPKSLPVYRFGSLDEMNVVHGITTRTETLPLCGNMSYMVGDAPEQVAHNRQAWAEAIGYAAEKLVLGRQVHETTVVPVDDSHAGSGADSVETSIRRVDGLMTSTPGLPIGVMAADCVPLLIHDPVRNVVAAVHAGWRGTVDGIATTAIESLKHHYDSKVDDIYVCLGPAICADCYQVGEEVIDRWESGQFSRVASPVEVRADGYHFDLREANRGQLLAAGIFSKSIEVSPLCTKCANGTMFSRRGLGPRTGLFTSVIMLPNTSELAETVEP